MIRQHLIGSSLAGEGDFRWRGGEITRLEGFSDAVFAFAVTLLVVSLEVPKTFHELMEAMRGFAAFAVCFALLAEVWSNHYRFFRRYGLQDPWAVFLNCVLLFFVLFYVYPLKFLFFTMFNNGGRIEAQQARALFIIYGAGYAALFLVFALLYLHAWRKREELALNQLERLKTRHSLIDHLAMVFVGLISVLLALSLPLRWVGMAGYFYFIIGAYFTLAGMTFGRRVRLLKEMGESSAASDPSR
ncbi:MAG TPA: TMEM175 family protein [Candidatus Dormibacteraeota bacterium]|nr:TMEM175 family protein [Candidatus Dormibacteraeota bacterium]